MSRTVASLATSVRSLRCWSEANDGPRERPSAPRERALDAEGGEELDRRAVGGREEGVRVEDAVGGGWRPGRNRPAPIPGCAPLPTGTAAKPAGRAAHESPRVRL